MSQIETKSVVMNSVIRRLSIFTPVLFGLMILFSSCSENMHSSVTKRQHRKGFYVNFAHKGKSESVVKTEKKELHSIATADTLLQKDDSSATLYAGTNEDFSQYLVASKPKKHNTVAEFVKKPNSVKSVIAQALKPAIRVKKTLKASAHASDGLSLLWLIVVVLLSLWIFGFLAGGWGLGGLIHLLLVIALILLILWLLRII